jgi:hypothetical protein
MYIDVLTADDTPRNFENILRTPMSAIDTFNWTLQQEAPQPDESMKKFIDDKRDYLLSLRSEDERRRFVRELAVQLKQMRGSAPAKRN